MLATEGKRLGVEPGALKVEVNFTESVHLSNKFKFSKLIVLHLKALQALLSYSFRHSYLSLFPSFRLFSLISSS